MKNSLTREDFLEVSKEECCIEDCLEVVKVHMRRGEFDLAVERCKDIQNSFRKIIKINKKYTLHNTIAELKLQGVQIDTVMRSMAKMQ